jgi:hydroxyethylthiazole kinase-like uncharacterized protein yjeF
MKIVTAAEMRAIDRATTERFGVPSLTLMENAGTAVAERVLSYGLNQRIVVFCGKGNNGADGLVAARILHERGKKVEIILLADPAELKGDVAAMYARLPIAATIVKSSDELKSDRVRAVLAADLYIDAIIGTGFNPPVRGLYADAIAMLNSFHKSILAVDIPSGADADATNRQQGIIVRADQTVTFTAARPGHVYGLLTQGPTFVADIGSPEEAIVSSLNLNVITARDFAALIGPRPVDSNKGNYGHVLVAGGSLGKAGAAAMAGLSALRTGAGLLTIATPKSVLATVAGFHPELMTEPMPETDSGSFAASAFNPLKALAKGKSVLAIGPGISRAPETAALVRSLVAGAEIPVVLDADGLNAFEGCTEELNGKGRLLVITPHPGEMARLAGCSIADVQKDRLGTARKFAREHELIVVLKGHRTLVVQPEGEAWVNMTGNPGMSTAGTGDILTGIVAAMIAQGQYAKNPKDALMAVCAAVHLHGLAGDTVYASKGEHSLIATDLLWGLPEAFGEARRMAAAKYPCWDERVERM